jgi:hypothetical protein
MYTVQVDVNDSKIVVFFFFIVPWPVRFSRATIPVTEQQLKIDKNILEEK